jgi:hypothetical protein
MRRTRFSYRARRQCHSSVGMESCRPQVLVAGQVITKRPRPPGSRACRQRGLPGWRWDLRVFERSNAQGRRFGYLREHPAAGTAGRCRPAPEQPAHLGNPRAVPRRPRVFPRSRAHCGAISNHSSTTADQVPLQRNWPTIP